MRGLKFDDLLAIMDFLYRGEANVFHENLDSFLAIAEELQLKGLTGNTEERVEDLDVAKKYTNPQNLSVFNTEPKNLKQDLFQERRGRQQNH